MPALCHRRSAHRRPGQTCRVAGLHFRDNGIDIGVGHLEGREQRQACLVMERLRSPIPGPAAGGALVDAVVAFVVEVMLGERRRILRVFERRRGAYAETASIGAPALHGLRIGAAQSRAADRDTWRRRVCRTRTAQDQETARVQGRSAPQRRVPLKAVGIEGNVLSTQGHRGPERHADKRGEAGLV